MNVTKASKPNPGENNIFPSRIWNKNQRSELIELSYSSTDDWSWYKFFHLIIMHDLGTIVHDIGIQHKIKGFGLLVLVVDSKSHGEV